MNEKLRKGLYWVAMVLVVHLVAMAGGILFSYKANPIISILVVVIYSHLTRQKYSHKKHHSKSSLQPQAEK